MSDPGPLFDADVRHRIRHALDDTLIVEAAAGTGKTTELVERIVNVLASGRARIGELVAVTFTEKAAGELKLRLRERLERERQAVGGAERRLQVERALSGLEEAHVNTIHGFCADILRERPVEAAVDPAFEVMVEGASERLYARVFEQWLQARLADPPPSLRRALHRQAGGRDDEDERGPVDRLRRCGWDLVEWRDFTAPWTVDPTFDRAAAMDHVRICLRDLAVLSASPRTTGDPLYQGTRVLCDASADLERDTNLQRLDLDEVEGRLVSLSRDIRVRDIRPGRGQEYGRGVARAAVYAACRTAVDALTAFAARADADLAAGLRHDLQHTILLYEEEKARIGRLDFLDLLLKTRDLLRNHPDVRQDLQQRFRRIFVDEFQDTDPIQAEILLLLASDDPDVSHWRDVRPRHGALFIVADPKQSIYRFRRADVSIYEAVKAQLRGCGVDALPLSSSFRSLPSIQRFVNGAFAPRMRGDERTQQAAYVPLRPYRRDRTDQPSLVALPVPRPYGTMRLSAQAIEKSLPAATGAFIQWLLNDSGWTVTERTPRTGDEVRVPIAPRHICLLFRRFETWGRDVTRPYVEALEARHVPHLLVGGRSFDQREEVETMTAALAAIEWPDDELSVFATLRGSLFAIPEAMLLAYRTRIGRFHPFRAPAEPPQGPRLGVEGQGGAVTDEPDCADAVEAMAILRRLHVGRNRIPVSATIAALLDQTRAHAGFALRPSGEQALANVLHIAELARRYETGGGLSFRGFVDELRDGGFGGTSEAPILEEGGEGVRIMTVHRAKGLEFPVVVLADMTTHSVRRQADRYLDPASGLCALRVLGCAPHDLIVNEADEVARNAAEADRLTYVAATRARDLLVVPAVGDEPYGEDRWLAPLSPMLYPPVEARRDPRPAPRCPTFGRDSVLERPQGDPARRSTVAPGLHLVSGSGPISDSATLATAGPAASATAVIDEQAGGPCAVVWWDPHVLDLDVRPTFGLRQMDLIGKDADPSVVAGDVETFRAWARERERRVAEGRLSTLTIETVRQRAPRSPEPAEDVPVTTIAVATDGASGVRFGTLLHDVLALTPLDAGAADVGALAAQRGRTLGATATEVVAATRAVIAVLAHDVMDRARRAAAAGRLRRESPVTLVGEDGAIVEGVVDLAFEESDGWQVVDFKTDRDIAIGLEAYRAQVGLYRTAIARATGRPARALLLQVTAADLRKT